MTDQTTTITPERAAYADMRARAVAGEYVDENELHRALEAAIASEERAAHAAAIDAERAAHKAAEAADIARKRKANEKKLAELVTALVEAREITAQAHQTMKSSITEYDRAVAAQNQALYALRAALTDAGYPTVQPRTGVESEYVDPERHPHGGGWVVWDGQTFGTAETARNAVPRFYHHLRAA
ncbi:MAG: hypothetical protein H5T76_23720 [Streptomyces sp.]|nr:hypothetical protein [Streptomyces sp.]